MSETFKRGDRVIVRDVVDGTNRDYVGRVGTLRIVSPDGRYAVLMDGPGDVRIVATAVESLIETLASAQERVSAQSPVAVAVGDRVVIRAVRHEELNGEFVGRTGKVVAVFQSQSLKGNCAVEIEGVPEKIVATAVERVGEFSVGDHVRIVQTRAASARSRAIVGKVGVITHVVRTGSWTTYLVDVDGDVYPAAAVEAAPEREQSELHPSERALYAAENHDWRDEEAAVEKLHRYGIIDDETLRHELQRINDERSRTAPDKKRTQAMEFARRILGADAVLDDLIGLANWLLDNPDASAKDIKRAIAADVYRSQWGEALRKASDLVAKVDGHYTADQLRAGGFLPNSAFLSPMIAEESKPETPRPPADQQITDKDGDVLKLHYNSTLLNTVALIEAHSHGDVCATYVTAEDADRIIAFLQDAKAARNT